ncbi:MAG TPA: hypothetical protein VE621_18035, partial [Bryobacteraceae bacterium]|nr:hypothetical protein [Bryobacteraceae bacterium]
MQVGPSINLTDPVAAGGFTLASNVIACPAKERSAEEVVDVAVGAFAGGVGKAGALMTVSR